MPPPNQHTGVPVAGDGYAIADGQGGAWCGATAQDGDLDPGLREADQHDNLQRYARLAGLSEPPQAPLAGRVAWRLVAPDRLPLIGGLAAPGMQAEQLRLQPRRALLTHMNHEIAYRDLAARLPAGVEPAYDGMVLDLPEP